MFKLEYLNIFKGADNLKLRVLLILLFIFIPGFMKSFCEDNKKVLAILDIEPKGEITPEIAEFVTERLRIEIFKREKFKLVERSKIRNILEEHKLQLTYSEDENYLKKVGNIFSADLILFGSLIFAEKKYYLNVRLVDTQTSEMIYGETKEANNISELSTIAEEISSEIAGEKVSKDEAIIKSYEIKEHESLAKMIRSVINYSLKALKEDKESEKNSVQHLSPPKPEKEIEHPKTQKNDNKKRWFKFGLEGFVKSGLNKLNFDEISFFSLQYGGRMLFGFGDFFGIGFYGAGSVENEKKEYETYYENIVTIFGYGGMSLQFHSLLWNFLRLAVIFGFGSGGMEYYLARYDKDTNSTIETNNISASFYFAEPEIRLGIRIVDIFEIGVLGSYFFTIQDNQAKKILDGFNAGVFITLGF
jgi:TolB-like protein